MDDREIFVITLDGPAGVGKTTLACAVAEHFGVAYLDTGAMYRSIAWTLGESSWEWPEEKLVAALEKCVFHLQGKGAGTRLFLNNEEIGEAIRTETAGLWASYLARLPLVRARLTAVQQSLGSRIALVAEGRDMGTVVFPAAAYKFFLDAAPAVRARRRWLQLKSAGKEENLDALTEQMRIRDEQDRNRAIAPLCPAPDAVIIDTGVLTRKEVLENIISAIGKTRCRQ